MGVNAKESGTDPFGTVAVPADVPGDVQRPLVKKMYATIPPGWEPPLIVAVSWTVVPTVKDVTAASVEFLMTVVTVGLVLVTGRGMIYQCVNRGFEEVSYDGYKPEIDSTIMLKT